MAEEQPKPQKPKKIDFFPFIQLLYSLERSTNELEKTWSESLDKENVQKAHSELLTLWESFTRNFPSLSEEQSAKLNELGFDTKVKRYPLDEEGFRQLKESSSLIDRYNQFSIASLYQMQNLLHALSALKEPTHKEISLPSGSTESWWEAGAFSLVRGSVRSLAFTLEQQALVYEELLGKPLARTLRPASMHYMDTLRILLNNELYEATPPIIIGATRFYVAERSGISVDKLPRDLAAKFNQVEPYQTLGYLYSQLEKVHQRLGLASAPDRGYLVPLVIGAVIQLEKLFSQPIKPELLKELVS